MKQTQNPDQLFSSSDLALITVIALYFPIEAINRNANPRKAFFLFKQSKELSDLIQSYWRGDLRVEPRAYFDQLRTIKARLYSQQP